MIRTFGGVTGLSNQVQGLDVGLSFGGCNVQRGVTTWTDSLTTKDIVIQAVNIQKSIIRITHGIASVAMFCAVAPTFVNASTIRLNRNTGAGLTTNTINWEVIEFSNVKSKQTGLKVTAGTVEETVSVTAVNDKKSLLFVHNTSTLNSQDKAGFMVGNRIVSPTSIGVQSDPANTVYWQLIELGG